jgi:putative YhdH/YhfP family quinone oxidoreductase
VQAGVRSLEVDQLPVGEVLIQVDWSSLNYKDALAATGHPGVARQLPHIPGVDAAGTVVASEDPRFEIGQEVLAMGHDLGADRWGGWSRYMRVPANWVFARPESISLREAMVVGTAGYTAAMCVSALQQHGVQPESGQILVTGATGGVGCLATKLLGRLGYSVVAVTGKPDWHDRLRAWGAEEILSREQAIDTSGKPLLSARWAGAVDTVGGATLATILRQTAHRGCVSACGLVGGNELSLTVYPFILRGVTLAGIDAAWCPMSQRLELWNRLVNEWRMDDLAELESEVGFDELPHAVERILAGEIAGRVIVRLADM